MAFDMFVVWWTRHTLVNCYTDQSNAMMIQAMDIISLNEAKLVHSKLTVELRAVH